MSHHAYLDAEILHQISAISIQESRLIADRDLTVPRTWGLYISFPDIGNLRSFRLAFGPHPRKVNSLRKEHPRVDVIAIFAMEETAQSFWERLEKSFEQKAHIESTVEYPNRLLKYPRSGDVLTGQGVG